MAGASVGLHPTQAEAEGSIAHLGSPGGDGFGYEEHKVSILPTPLSGREQAEWSDNGSRVVH